MDPIWYTIRIVVTVIMTGIGGLLLWAASLVAPNVNGAALSWMVLLGLVIPGRLFRPGATLMKVSIDPAWQDADDKFRQIIARCTKYAEF
jgi:ABC-type enterochelin transport system permease subunit